MHRPCSVDPHRSQVLGSFTWQGELLVLGVRGMATCSDGVGVGWEEDGR